MTSLRFGHVLVGLVGAGALAVGCNAAPKEPAPSAPATSVAPSSPTAVASPVTPAQPTPPAAAPAPAPPRAASGVPVSPDDPLKGSFALADATEGLAGSGSLTATIETDIAKLDCKLFDDKAPTTVANFVGLARGIRPWKDSDGKWVKRPAYDGTVFHRVIKGFMIQGGDAKGTGAGEPGYVIPDEVWPGAKHDRAGLLCMANRGKDTNGAQFFITDAAAPHLDGGYTIFGQCGPEEMVHKLASVEVMGERPKSPPKIKSVKISRAK